YGVYENKLKELQPDIIITQDQCEVCAVNLEDVEKAAHKVLESHPQIVSLAPNTLDEIWNSIEKVAKTLNVHEKGRQVVSQLKQRVDTIYNKTQPLTNRPTVTCIEWIDPLMAAGHWMPEFIEMLGGKNIFGEAGKHSPKITWEELKEKNPDIMISMPCGWGMDRCRQEMKTLTSKPDWSTLKAVREGHVYLADGNQYFNRPGPRVVESLEILAEILNPRMFDFGHENTGWIKL
ncbi:cobalamin-binding protein, partial [candidate division KSB1 bacterium]|nr:cobalamin-binding protein [candidate division KSB1 bacterium]